MHFRSSDETNLGEPITRGRDQNSLFASPTSLLVSSFLGYFLFAVWFPLGPNFGRLMGIRAFTPSLWSGIAYALLFSALYGMYWLLYCLVRKGIWRPSLLGVLLTAAAYAFPLLFTYPFNANDIFRYVIRGRISSAYGANPFLIPPNQFNADPFLHLAGEWAGATSPYGPLWELMAWLTTSVTQQNLWVGLVAFKLLGLVAHLAIGLLIWGALPAQGTAERRAKTLLWVLNPALLLIFTADGHNDALMLLFLVAGWWLMKQERPQLGFWLMLLAPLTKPIALLPLPFFFLAVWRKLGSYQTRVKFTFLTMLTAIGLIWLAFLPFGSPLALANRLLNEASGGASFSLAAALILTLTDKFQVPLTQELFSSLLAIGIILLGVTALWLAWRTFWHGRSAVKAAADVFVVYILQAFNFRLWYSAWPFPFLVLEDGAGERPFGSKFRLYSGLWFLYFVQISVVIFGHGWAYLFNRDLFLAHAIGAPFTFILPFIFGWWGANRSVR